MLQNLVLALTLILAIDQPAPTDALTGVKCVVSGKSAHPQYSAEYLKGHIYFNCNASRLQFENDAAHFKTKANHQLVVSGQYVQMACPITGERISESTPVKQQWAGVNIRLCCDHCRTKLQSRGDFKEQVKFIFGGKQFEKTFKPKKKPQHLDR